MTEDTENIEYMIKSFIVQNPGALAGALTSLDGKIFALATSQEMDKSQFELICSLVHTYITKIKTKISVDFVNQTIIECKEFKIHVIPLKVKLSLILILTQPFSLLLLFKFQEKLEKILNDFKDQQEPEQDIVDNKFTSKNLLNQKSYLKVIAFSLLTTNASKIHYFDQNSNKKMIQEIIDAIRESTIDLIKYFILSFENFLISSRNVNIIISQTKQLEILLAIIKNDVGLGRPLLFMKNLLNFTNLNEFENASNKIYLKMQTEKTNSLTLKRKALLEIFTKENLNLNSKNRENPCLNEILKTYLGFKGIKVEYNSQDIIFKFIYK